MGGRARRGLDRSVGLIHFIGVQQRLEEILGCKVDLVSKRGLRGELRDDVQWNLLVIGEAVERLIDEDDG